MSARTVLRDASRGVRGAARALAGLMLLVVAAVAVAPPARADDIGAAARGVVRVVTIAVVDGQVVGFGHGSGVAVAPNRIVTNAHVVELAQRYPDNVVVGVVPSEGDKSYQGHVVAYDATRDLALVEFAGASLPPATLYTGPSSEGDPVVALGYPGNVDLATARSAADYIQPTEPVRSEGVFSGRRQMSGTAVLLHTAPIARGNSGGPLLDRCGRVIGINSALTRTEDGDSTFGFAIADSELAGFLRGAGQAYRSVGLPCTSIEDRLRADSDADAAAVARAEEARREAATRAALAREDMLASARDARERSRENVMAVAALLLVGGALSLGGAGLLAGRARREPAWWAAGGGVVLVIAATVLFVLRPSTVVTLPPPPITVAPAAADVALGHLTCHFDPARSRVTVSSTDDVPIDWGQGGCMNGHTPYVAAASRWERVLVPDREETVSVLGFDPATRTYSDTRYYLTAPQMKAARAARGASSSPAQCGDVAAIDQLGERQGAIKATLPPLPNEKLVYSCSPAG